MPDQSLYMLHIFLFCHFPFIFVIVKSLFVKEGVNVNCKVESIEDASADFIEEVIVTKQRDSTIDTTDSLTKAVKVDVTHHLDKWSWPGHSVNAGENKLEKVKDTGAIVTAREILEDDIRATKLRLQITLIPEQKIFSAQMSVAENTKAFQVSGESF